MIGVDRLLQLVQEKNLVTGLSERELKSPEGTGFDLRLGRLHRIHGRTKLGIETRETVAMETAAQFDEQNPASIVIKPGEFYLSETHEQVNMPLNLTALITPRSTLYRSGIVLTSGNVGPGYNGTLSFGLFNAGGCEFEIELGARFVHIMFFEVEGEAAAYRGQWQGGRVVGNGEEVQV